jgi:hypothetical protein
MQWQKSISTAAITVVILLWRKSRISWRSTNVAEIFAGLRKWAFARSHERCCVADTGCVCFAKGNYTIPLANCIGVGRFITSGGFAASHFHFEKQFH